MRNAFNIGARMRDGTIYAGISPDTGYALYAMPEDSGVMKWDAAMEYASRLYKYGHDDWVLPSDTELNILYINKDRWHLKDTFDVSNSCSTSRYMSSTVYEHRGTVFMQNFCSYGNVQDWDKKLDASVRLVRRVPSTFHHVLSLCKVPFFLRV